MQFERIRRLREEHEYKQDQVAQAVNITQRSYSYYETGQRMIPPQALMRLAFFYDTSVDYLLGLTDDTRPPAYNAAQTRGFAKREPAPQPL